MPIRYIPIDPIVLRGQAVLGNFTRALRYSGNQKPGQRLQRGLPLYELQTVEQVRPHSAPVSTRKSASNQPPGPVNPSQEAPNLIVHGECQAACAHLLATGQKVDLVYIDPPFASGANYGKKILLRRHPHAQADTSEDVQALEADGWEETLYGDIWNKEDYLNWMYENLTAIKAVMSDTASIYVHLDWHIGHYVKILLDEVFGEENFKNEIIWRYSKYQMRGMSRFVSNHDVIYWYAKGESHTFNPQTEILDEAKLLKRKKWDAELARIVNVRDANGSLIYDEYLEGKVDDVWELDIIGATSGERLDYPTQKPESLLKRVIESATTPGMLVADFFGGSGVTAKVAHDLGRRFVHTDIGQNSIQTARDRLAGAGATFDVLRVQDGVQLFRNPAQTMAKLKGMIPGLTTPHALQPLPDYWAGIFASQGAVPVALPNLLDSASRVFDEAALHKLTMEELPKLAEWDYPVQNVVVYTIDIADPDACEAWLNDHNPSGIAVELRDIKPLLGDVVLGDELQARVEQPSAEQPLYRVVLERYHSDYLARKLTEVVSKKALQPSALASKAGQAKTATLPVGLSQDGLECIEWLSLDCVAADGPWHSSVEAKIDVKNRLTLNGVRQTTAWNGTLLCAAEPRRLRVRNVAGDELTLILK